jgi:PAS domain S-box-containing protein
MIPCLENENLDISNDNGLMHTQSNRTRQLPSILKILGASSMKSKRDRIESKAEHGSSSTVWCPQLLAAEVQSATKVSTDHQQGDRTAMLSNTRVSPPPATRVLVIDDGGSHAEQIKTLFANSRGQYKVDWAFDLADTVQSVHENEHDVCLLAIADRSPVSDCITEERVDFPVILLTDRRTRPEVYELAAMNRFKYLSFDGVQTSDLEHAMKRSIHKPLHELTNDQQSVALDAAKDGIAIVGSGGVVTFANQALANMYGFFSPSDLLNTDIRSLFADEYTDAIGYAAMEAAKIEGNWQGEAKGVRQDGSVFHKEVTVQATNDNGFVFIERDATATHDLRAQLYHAQKIEGIGQLAGGIVHDFNNLLSAVMGYSQLGLVNTDEDSPIRDYFEEIEKAAERAALLTRRLLTFSSKTIAEPKVVDLNKLITDINNMLSRLISENIEFSTELGSDMKHVEVDAGQMEQVLVNLVVNARDAMPRGGRLKLRTDHVTIEHQTNGTIAGLEPGKYVVLAVEDNGTGMTDEVQDRLFEPFFSTKGEGKGTGLGLSICEGIVSQFGGTISVDSVLGHGSTFKIYLPFVLPPGQSAPSAKQQSLNIHMGNETILVVEDESAVRRVLTQVLEQQGHTVLQASNGKEALKIAREFGCDEIDLLVTDMVMPVMGGRALATEFKDICPSAKILYTSGYTDDELLRSGELDSDSAFMRKPFDLNTLSRLVHELLNEHSPSRVA